MTGWEAGTADPLVDPLVDALVGAPPALATLVVVPPAEDFELLEHPIAMIVSKATMANRNGFRPERNIKWTPIDFDDCACRTGV
jgi:hypothetical protein